MSPDQDRAELTGANSRAEVLCVLLDRARDVLKDHNLLSNLTLE